MKNLDPDIATVYSQSSLLMTYLWHLLGCLMCCPLSDDVFASPVMTREEEDRQVWLKGYEERSFIFHFGYTTLMRMMSCLGYCLFPQLKRRGNSVILWTF